MPELNMHEVQLMTEHNEMLRSQTEAICRNTETLDRLTEAVLKIASAIALTGISQIDIAQLKGR